MDRLIKIINQISKYLVHITLLIVFLLFCAALLLLLGPAAILVILLLLIFASVVLALNTAIVPQSEAWVVEQLGRFYDVWHAGYHILWPGLMTVREKVSLREKFMDIEPQEAITKDHINIEIDTIAFYQITDPELYTYGVENPEYAIKQLAMSNLRNIVGTMTEKECLTGQNTINEQISKRLDEAADSWGVKFTRLEVQNITLPEALRKAIQDSEAVKERAEGDAEAIRKTQKAIADSLTYFKGGPDTQTVKSLQDQMVRMKALDAIGKVADGKATKIIIPSELQGLAGFAAGMQTILDNGGTGSLLGGGAENNSGSPPEKSETRMDSVSVNEDKADAPKEEEKAEKGKPEDGNARAGESEAGESEDGKAEKRKAEKGKAHAEKNE